MPILASRKDCTGCLACVDSCKHNALNFRIEEDGHIYVHVDASLCVGCNLCERACPIVSEYPYTESSYSDFYASWNKNIQDRKRSASGGVFSAIATYILDQGGVVFGASIVDGYEVHHIYIDKKENLYQLQGSKYAYSITDGVYNQVLAFLKEKRLVLFSGTACQVAGLLSFLSKKRYSGKLVTVDLICGGVPSRFLIKKFVENESYQVRKIESFRTKDDGWKSHGFKYNLKIQDNDGKIHNYKDVKNLITDGFCLELTNRYSCYNCKFVGRNRKSDFTIGDLWGDMQYPEQHFDGVSVLISHTENSKELLESCLEPYLSYYPVDAEDVIKHNPRLVNGKNYLRFSPIRRYLPFLFQHLDYITLKKCLAYDFSNKSIWMIYKVLRRIIKIIFAH